MRFLKFFSEFIPYSMKFKLLKEVPIIQGVVANIIRDLH